MPPAKSVDIKVGYDLEGTYGTPVKAAYLLDVVDDDIKGVYNRIQSQAKRPSRARRKSAAGSAEVGGSLTCEIGPLGISRLLYAIFGAVTTVGAASPYVHTFKPDPGGPKPFTHVRAVGPVISVQSCMPAEATFRAELDQMVQLELAATGIYEKVDTRTVGRDTALFGTAAYPTSDPFSFIGAQVTLNGAVTDDVASWSTRINNGMITQRGLRRNRWAKNQQGNALEVEHSLRLYFSTEAELRKYMGATGSSFPFEAGNTVLTGSLKLELSDLATVPTLLTLESATVEFEAPQPPIAGDDYLMLDLVAVGLDDAANGALKAVLTNSTEANATVIAAGTNIVWA